MIRFRMIGPITYIRTFLALLRVRYVCPENLTCLRGKAELLETGKPILCNLLYCSDNFRRHYKFTSDK